CELKKSSPIDGSKKVAPNRNSQSHERISGGEACGNPASGNTPFGTRLIYNGALTIVIGIPESTNS
ncbi:MAG: hypothetical protein ACI92S_001031, partial [Planctomycetaceae bacterium]